PLPPQLAVPERCRAPPTSAGDTPADVSASAQTPAALDDAFLDGLGDAQLAQLVDEALHANHDLRIALSRIDRANALLRNARLDMLPTVTAQGEAADVRSSADQA